MIREEARLIILRALAEQQDETLSSSLLQLELETFGINRERPFVHAELDFLAEIGAVIVTPANTVMVAKLTTRGRRHLDRHIALDGVKRPSREEP